MTGLFIILPLLNAIIKATNSHLFFLIFFKKRSALVTQAGHPHDAMGVKKFSV
jgi:hypothetical protein